jgi:hypothetical protein
LWELLADSQRQQLCLVLSELVARRLLSADRKGASHETQ